MVKRLLLTLWLAALAPAAAGADTQPTEASILALMEVIHAEQNVASVEQQMTRMVQSSIDQASEGQELGPERREILDDMERRMLQLIHEETGWQRMKPDIVAIYRDAYSQEEIDAMLDFYGSPVGQSVIAKMPTVMRKSMQVAQRQMMSVMPRIREIQKETLRQLQSLQ